MSFFGMCGHSYEKWRVKLEMMAQLCEATPRGANHIELELELKLASLVGQGK